MSWKNIPNPKDLVAHSVGPVARRNYARIAEVLLATRKQLMKIPGSLVGKIQFYIAAEVIIIQE